MGPDTRIAAAFAEEVKSEEVRCVLEDVQAAAKEAEAAAEDARTRALDPLVEDVIVARRAMDDAAFERDRLIEAAKRLGVRVDVLRTLEKERAQRAEHEQVLAERNRLAKEMEGMAEAIVWIAHLVSEIEACNHEIGRINATSALGFGYIRTVLSGSAPAIAALFRRLWSGMHSSRLGSCGPKRRS
jgi:hypothetical protein